MLCMEPSIKRGLTFWDRALMPRDEFEQRLRNVRKLMRERGLGALIVSGNMYEDADLAYLIGPGVDGTLVITLNDDPIVTSSRRAGAAESFFSCVSSPGSDKVVHVCAYGYLSRRGRSRGH